MKKYYILVTLFFVFSVTAIQAQKSFMKFGSIPDMDIEMSRYSPDTSAHAVILGDFGHAKFMYVADKGWVINYERHVRIKIFDKQGFDWADFEVLLYQGKSGRNVNITSIKAFTINMEDGKPVKYKLERSAIFTEKVDKNYNKAKFTMPNVKENSILEVNYSIEDPYLFTLFPWVFQYTIPVRESEYHVYIPEYFYYKNWINGYVFIQKESEKRIENYQFIKPSTIQAGLNSGGRQSGGIVNFEADVTHWTYHVKNVPAFVHEPYITTPSDYLSSLEFELVKYEIPGVVYENYTKDWAEINKDMMDDYDFGKQLDNTGHLKDQVTLIQLATEDPVLKMQMAYESIKRNMVWDKRYRIYPETSIRAAYGKHGGSSADINLNLVAMLRALKFDANPVLTSTRSHGKIKPGQVILTQFNHVVATVKIGDRNYVLDAVDPYCPAFMLPPNSLNGQGMMIGEKGYGWIDLYSTLPWEERVLFDLQLTDEFEFTGKIQQRYENFAALSVRKDVKEKANQEEYQQVLEQKMEGLIIEELTIQDLDSIYKPVTIEAQVVLQDKVIVGGDRIYFNPILFDRIEQNKFKNSERKFPIDYTHPYRLRYTYIIKLPEGYVVEEIPKPVQVALPDNGGKYVYVVRGSGNQISIQYEFTINQTIFPSVNYGEIKQFYELMVASQSEQVVAKRTN
jgi:hypothetical protein